jgi:hypothetical protein
MARDSNGPAGLLEQDDAVAGRDPGGGGGTVEVVDGFESKVSRSGDS